MARRAQLGADMAVQVVEEEGEEQPLVEMALADP